MFQNSKTIVIVEPNPEMIKPYVYLGDKPTILRVNTINQAVTAIGNIIPELILLSASFSPQSTIKLLETIKRIYQPELIPIIQVVDRSNKISYIPGVSWNHKIRTIDNFFGKKEFLLVVKSVME